jgi:hypothetical protein
VGSEAAAERTLSSIQSWIEKHLRLKVNPARSGTGRVEERKFLGFRLNRETQIGIAPGSIERLKAKVRELWRGRQSLTSNELRDRWKELYPRLVGILPTGRGQAADLPAGRLDTPAHPEMLLAAVA